MPGAVRIMEAYPSALSGETGLATDTVEKEPFNFKATVNNMQSSIGPLQFSWNYTRDDGTPVQITRVSFLSRSSYFLGFNIPMVPDWQPHSTFTMNVAAKGLYWGHDHGSSSYRLIVHRQFEVERMSERDKPSNSIKPVVEAVSAPYPGGNSGVNVTYTESHCLIKKYEYKQKESIEFSAVLPALKIGYGIDFSETISSADALKKEISITHSIPSGKVGVWYRKTEAYERHSDLYRLDALGNRNKVDEVLVIGYLFSCYLGIGKNENEAHLDARRRLGIG